MELEASRVLVSDSWAFLSVLVAGMALTVASAVLLVALLLTLALYFHRRLATNLSTT